MSGQLERLLAEATPGPWSVSYGRHPEEIVPGDVREFAFVTADPPSETPFLRRSIGLFERRSGSTFADDARLIALTPDLARLLVDAMAALERCKCKDGYTLTGRSFRDTFVTDPDAEPKPLPPCRRCSLLARFAVVEQKAGEGQG